MTGTLILVTCVFKRLPCVLYNKRCLTYPHPEKHMSEYSKRQSLPYPAGLLRLLLRLPLLLHRLGLGWMLSPFPFFVLTTRGRKSGLPRHAVLEWRRHGSRFYVVSAWGRRSQWLKNLVADPIVTVQNGHVARRARACVVEDPAETLRAVYMFRKHSPLYDRILSSISSADTIDFLTLSEVADEFTVVRLEPEAGEPALPGVRPAYVWVWLVVPVLLIIRWLWTRFV